MLKRFYFLDNLRILLICLVIITHTAITYGAVGGWYYVEISDDSISSVLLTIVTAVNQSFFMGLFFFISGYFIPLSYDKKGRKKFIKDKCMRLGIPLFVFIFILSPLLEFFLNQNYYHTLLNYYQMNIVNFKNIEFGPLWFVEALIYFNIIYLLIRSLNIKISINYHKKPTFFFVIITSIFVSILTFIVRINFPVGANILNMQLGHFTSYIVLFILGILAYRTNLFSEIYLKTIKFWVIYVIIIFLTLPFIAFFGGAFDNGFDSFIGGFNLNSLLYSFWETFIGFGIIITLLKLFRRKFDKTNPFLKTVSGATFTVYIIHPFVLIPLSILLKGFNIFPPLKFLFVSTIVIIISFLVAILIKKIPYINKVL